MSEAATICKQRVWRGEGESDVLFKGLAASVDKGVQDGASEQVCVSEGEAASPEPRQ